MTFTNTAKAIDEEITKSQVDIKLRELSSQLTDKFQRLETTQESIFELLLNENQENEYSKDFNEAEICRERYLSLKSKIENFENNSESQSVKSSCDRKYRLPKLELKKFNGDIKSFLGLWSQFSRIHEDEEMLSEDKFQYLIQAITSGTRASSPIESFPPAAQNYPKAIELLKETFGRGNLLVQVYVGELIKMVMKNAISERKCADLTTLYDQLESHLRALDTLGRSKEKFADFLSPLVESCLPEDVLRAWERHRTSSILNNDAELPVNSQISLENLMAFLRQEVNGEEIIKKETLSQGLFGGNQTPEAEHYRDTINVERIDGRFSCQVSVLDQPKICRTLPRVRNKHLLAELENHGIVLTDIGEETPPIRLLLGADVLGRILSGTIQFYVENKILKIRSRLILGQDLEDFVRPTVLPDHPIIRRLIAYAHKTLHYAGVQTTLRYTSKPVVPVVPVDRINRVAAFEVTGADLASPIYLKGGEKAWIEIFTCAVYRAIHLELVTSLSTEAFMQAMRRNFARRRRSSIMYTDNGTNFWGTSRALSNLNLQEIIAECAIQNIKWHFNPPAAPWYRGWWERMICIIKQLLRNVLGRACVTYEEMVTLLCECESVVNECPLTYLYDDPNELRAIKPPDFT
ncbi:hypothetical protein AVEN_19164-1 [Araneus ventricosus]|uniref:Integrase catalytic domain-containing protein n=1 Tax=Araneus ventricosus TaxID=182803 RepID=A0A4Y2UJD4_ARAVE|nr:hypothetical protein AVEN_19164-1 [Araneus ventricosus]